MKIYIVQYNDYLEQRILGGFDSIFTAEAFMEKQEKEGYGWFEIIEIELEKPFALRSISKRFISGGKEINPQDLSDLFEGIEEEEYFKEEDEEDN